MNKKTEFFSKCMLLLSAATLSLGATACNTVKGLGEDIKSVGQAGEEAID